MTEAIEGRTAGSRVLYTLQEGEKAMRVASGIVVTHPDRPPKLVTWDGAEQPITLLPE